MAQAWKRYCEKLYQAEEDSDGSDEIQQEVELLEYQEEPEIVLQQVKSAILYLKNNKVPGPDEVTAESPKAGGKKAPKHLVTLIKNLYDNRYSMVHLNNEVISGKFQTGGGVKQGCILSSLLFNLHGEYVMRKVLQNDNPGCKTKMMIID